MGSCSKFSKGFGILFAADISDTNNLKNVLDQICDHIRMIKLGNSVLYRAGSGVIRELKRRYSLPVVADLKLTDVSHISQGVVAEFVDQGADAIVLSGICGPIVLSDAIRVAGAKSEIWAFTEFTNDSGLIDVQLADQIIRTSRSVGIVGFQVPGTRPERVTSARADLGSDVTIISCGIGAQGTRFGAAITEGANYEIIGRAIYLSRSPANTAHEASTIIESVVNPDIQAD